MECEKYGDIQRIVKSSKKSYCIGQQGKGYKKIVRALSVLRDTVGSIIRKFKVSGTVDTLPGVGTYWVALYVRANWRIWYFDSWHEASQEIVYMGLPFVYNSSQNQSLKSVLCGYLYTVFYS